MKKIILSVLTVVVFLAMIGAFVYVTNFNDTECTVTITDKERVYDTSSSKYIIFAEDKDGNTVVFENTDAFFRGKFSSSDIQGQLKVGEEYTLVVIGFRVPFLSLYQNIIRIEE